MCFFGPVVFIVVVYSCPIVLLFLRSITLPMGVFCSAVYFLVSVSSLSVIRSASIVSAALSSGIVVCLRCSFQVVFIVLCFSLCFFVHTMISVSYASPFVLVLSARITLAALLLSTLNPAWWS